MTSAVYRHEEPGKIPAAILALLVHCAFFVFLYMGVSWTHKKEAEAVFVDAWSSLPELPAPQKAAPPPKLVEEAKPPPKPVEELKPAPKAEPEQAGPKPDIALKEKADKERQLKEQKVKEEADRKKREQEDLKLAAAREQADAQAAARLKQEQEDALKRVEEQKTADFARLKAEYIAKITSKIRSRIVMPPDIKGDEQVEIDVILVPGGDVLSVKVKKVSGNAAYDSAVERAIYKAQPLPLPPDPALFKDFRDLALQFRAKEES